MKQLKLSSLFDGISAFPLAAQLNGIEPIWASEIDPFPIQVSEKHFPGMKHLGSVIDICLCVHVTHFKGTQCQMYINNSQDIQVEPVDIITFGSPCQDLSVAGKRSGLEGERSGLFYEAVRIIDEMREVTNGEYPTFAIWENVPGAFSSNSGEDFACVISSLVGAEVHCPRER